MILIAAAVGLPALIAALAGSFALPADDDWAFGRQALHLHATGDLEFIGWAEMTLVGQLVWAQPFLSVLGPSFVALHIAGLAAAGAALAGTYALFNQVVPRSQQLLALATVCVSPLVVILAPTFMTDLPGLACEMWTLALGVRALRTADGRQRTQRLAVAVGVGLAGFTVREPAGLAPAALLLVAIVSTSGRAERRRLVAVATGAVIFALGFYMWRHGLQSPTTAEHPSHFDPVRAEALFVQFVGLFAILWAPLLFETWSLTLWLARARVWAVCALWLIALAFLTDAYEHGGALDPFPGNLITRAGVLGPRAGVFPTPIWVAVCAGAFVGAIWLVTLVADSLRTWLSHRTRPEPDVALLGAFVALYGVALAVRAGSGAGIFDRYGLSISIAAIPLLLRRRAPRSGVSKRALLALVPLAAFSMALESDFAAFSSARWQAGTFLVARGWSPGTVDAGFEWAGLHRHGNAIQTRGPYQARLIRRVCATVSTGPESRAGPRLVGRWSYRSLGGLTDRTLWLYEDPACARATDRG